jgi:hypothetical protein
LINNLVMSVILSPILIRSLKARIQRMKIDYAATLSSEQISKPPVGKAGGLILLAIVIAVYLVMMAPALTQLAPLNNTVLVAASILLTILSLVLL